MPALAPLLPFEEAIKALQKRGVLPTQLDSAALRNLGGLFHRQNFTSARSTITGVLDTIKASVESILNPRTVQRADRITPENPQGNVTVGLNPAAARLAIKESLRRHGYTPDPAERGTIKDLSSEARINLQIKTNLQLQQGQGRFLQMQDPEVLDAFPAQELIRIGQREQERNWDGQGEEQGVGGLFNSRWYRAAQAAGDVAAARILEETGRMIARKDSGIWQELGNAEDGLGNPYPPFAFGSGMGVRNVAYGDALELGLIQRGEQVQPKLPPDLAEIFQAN